MKMTFGNFVENVTETPICCELKQHLDKLQLLYVKDPEKCMLSLNQFSRGSAKIDMLIFLPLFLKMYENGIDFCKSESEVRNDNI